jgi:hypothetical protein
MAFGFRCAAASPSHQGWDDGKLEPFFSPRSRAIGPKSLWNGFPLSRFVGYTIDAAHHPIMAFIMERILSMSMPFDFIMFMQKGIISAIVFCGSFAKISAMQGIASFMNANFSSLLSALN